MIRPSHACALIALLAAAHASHAAERLLPGTGEGMSAGAADAHWQVVSGPGITTPQAAVVVNDQHPFGQYFSNNTSLWIWADASGSSTVGATYRLELSFDLTGVDVAGATLSGLWGVDNHGRMLLNGQETGVELAGGSFDNFNTIHDFTLTSGLVAGVNRLSFDVVDDGNPAALNVFSLVVNTAPVPEPAAWLLMAGGLAALAVRRRA